MKFYAGIGSRETPKEWLEVFAKLGKELAKKGWTLRSGHAGGADLAFEDGCNLGNGKKEIFLPWKGFNGSGSSFYNVSEEMFKMAEEFHPAWNRCSDGGKKLHARNCGQILGENLDTPCKMVLCWTVNGSGQGGTGQAIRIAKKNNIPIFDFGKYIDFKNATPDLEKFIEKHGLKSDNSSINVYSMDKNGYQKLSNLLNGPVSWELFDFPTVEHLYQYRKALFAADQDAANYILEAKTGWDVQRLSKMIQGLDKEKWDKKSSLILKDSMKLAFRQNKSAMDLLLSTGSRILTHKSPNKLNLGKWEKEFPKILMELRTEFRETIIRSPKVVHCKGNSENTEKYHYIGRPKGNERYHFGNPFSHENVSKASVKVSNRDAACEAFKDWLTGTNYEEIEPVRRDWILDNLSILKGKDLGCWCSPKRCHGDYLLEISNE